MGVFSKDGSDGTEGSEGKEGREGAPAEFLALQSMQKPEVTTSCSLEHLATVGKNTVCNPLNVFSF